LLDTNVYEGERFANQSSVILDIKTHFKPTGTLFSVNAFLKLPPIRGQKGLRLLRTNSSEAAFKTAISQFKTNLIEREYPETLILTTLAEIAFEERKSALQQKRKQLNTRILPFVTQYRPSVAN